MPADNQKYFTGLSKPDAYTPYAAGAKRYGRLGGTAPNIGPTSAEGTTGYIERDVKARARKTAMQRKIKAEQAGKYMSSNYLGG